MIDGAGAALHERLLLENFGREPVELPVALVFRAGFEDVFAVRELPMEPLGLPHTPIWMDDGLSFSYDGADGVWRGMTVRFSPAPDTADGTTARWRLTLSPRQRASILVSIALAESTGARSRRPKVHGLPGLRRLERIQRCARGSTATSG